VPCICIGDAGGRDHARHLGIKARFARGRTGPLASIEGASAMRLCTPVGAPVANCYEALRWKLRGELNACGLDGTFARGLGAAQRRCAVPAISASR
jgi:hypothetical protein